MAEPYDMTFRERAVGAYQSGEGGYHDLAALFGVGYRTLQRWVARARQTGSVAPVPKGGGNPCPIDLEVLERVVRELPDGTMLEFTWEYNRRVPVAQRTNDTSFRRAMRRAGFVRKKNGPVRRRSTGQTWQRAGRRG